MNRAVITRFTMNNRPLKAFVLIDENRKWLDLHVEREDISSKLNEIYVGKVSNIVKNIEAAFVSIDKDTKCFLPLKDLSNPIYTTKPSKSKDLCIGDELLIQITKDAVKTKDAVASSKLILHGKYTFLSSANFHHSVSKKLNDEKRKELLLLLNQVLEEEGYLAKERYFGLVFRTNAGNASIDELKEDILSLIGKYNALLAESKHQVKYTKVYSTDDFAIQQVKQLELATTDQIMTDQEDMYQKLCFFFPELAHKFVLYKDTSISLQTLYGFRSNFEELTSNKVWLKSGGNIIIESLETLTAIDINSGKALKKDPSFLLAINKESAKEIARQLRLRSISGMIIIDFINLSSEEEKAELISCLKAEIKKDHVPCSFIDITKLGLVELTRKKVKRSLYETLYK